ncbi:hypothetical protein BDD12DRAFT_722918, partial [Trichophaea hybrida]
ITDYSNLNVEPKYRGVYPHPLWKFENWIRRISRKILLTEYIVNEWADHFKDMDEVQLDEIAQSFKFDNCILRDELNKVLFGHKGLANK